MIIKTLASFDIALIGMLASTEYLEDWGKLGAIGVLGALLALMLWKTIPEIQKVNAESRSAESAANSEALKSMAAAFDNLSNRIDDGNRAQVELLSRALNQKNSPNGF